MMNIFSVNDKKSYELALNRIFELSETAEVGTDEYNELEILSTLVEAYEEKEYPIEADPIEVIKLMMAYKGLKPADLTEKLESSKGYISKILNYEKPLTLTLIRQFSNALEINPKSLIDPYPVGWQNNYRPFLHCLRNRKWRKDFVTQFASGRIFISYHRKSVKFELFENRVKFTHNNRNFYVGKNIDKGLKKAVEINVLFNSFLKTYHSKYLKFSEQKSLRQRQESNSNPSVS